MRDDAGLILGRFADEWLYDTGDDHVLLVGPTGAGKGVGLVVPNLIRWPHSLVEIGVKTSNYRLTGAYRAALGEVLYFRPGDVTSGHLNPAASIRPGLHEVSDAQTVAHIVVSPSGESSRKDPHWEATAFGLLTGIFLYVRQYAPVRSLGAALGMLTDPGLGMDVQLKRMLASRHKDIASIARTQLNRDERERAAVWSTATRCLELWRDPTIARLTSQTDIPLEALQYGQSPVSMYLSMPPGDLRLQPLFQLLVQQLLTYLTAEDRPGPRRPVLLIFDDFRSLGALMPFVAALGHLREYKVRCLVVLQDLEQLKEVGAESVLGNCSIRIFFRANDERSAQRISRMLDTCTVTETRATISRPRYGWGGRQSVSEGPTVHGRPLLTVGELINLPPEQAIVFTGRVPAPILAEKIRYYEHPEFHGSHGKNLLDSSGPSWTAAVQGNTQEYREVLRTAVQPAVHILDL